MAVSVAVNIPAVLTGQFDAIAKAIRHKGCGFCVTDRGGNILYPGGDMQNDRPGVDFDPAALPQAEQTTEAIKQNDDLLFPVVIEDREYILALTGTSGERQPYFRGLLEGFAAQLISSGKYQQQIEIVSGELAHTYEELVLLYNLSTNMKVTHSIASYLQMACDYLIDLVNVEGIAVVLKTESENGKDYVLTAGSGYISIGKETADIMEDRLKNEIERGKDGLIDSQAENGFEYTWPENVNNIIAVPLLSGERRIGIMYATNRLDNQDFDSTDVKLFNSVANQCAVFIENDRLFGDMKELFIGSLMALTNSIDAKDQYTRGHSERVAFISRWIAERYSESHKLDEDYIHKIYLSGLLHDIGKIGINEILLRKKGKLSPEETEQIKAHPRIGAAILNEIKQMRDVIPGVLCHHERPDGNGYPDGLKGDKIPMIGRIIGLADAFDAMTSKRTYRDALTHKRALKEIEKGLGTQFDKEIGQIFIKSDINKLWSIIHDGFIESWDYSNFSEYGSIAVGSLIKQS